MNAQANEMKLVIDNIKEQAGTTSEVHGTAAEKATTILSTILGTITATWASVKALDKRAVINSAWSTTKRVARTVWDVSSMFLSTRVGKMVAYTATASTALLIGGLLTTGAAPAVLVGTVLTGFYYIAKDVVLHKDDLTHKTSFWGSMGKALLATTALAVALWVTAPMLITGTYYMALSVLCNFVIIFG